MSIYRVFTITCLASLLLSGCDGSDGRRGPAGTPGPQGTAGLNSLVVQTELPVGDEQCPDGGTLIQSGLDENSDGILSETEVEESSVVCGPSPEPVCDLSTFELLDFEAWRREEGYWIGEYTFLGADGNPFQSSSWPYPYDHYKGFLRIELDGGDLRQRNVFLYPPQDASACGAEGDVVGTGDCSVNGNEKIFAADQSATDCSGSLSGPYTIGSFVVDTTTRLIGDDTVLYQVRLFEDGPLLQNQLTSLPGNDTRIRTAQGLNNGDPSYASFYRERRVLRDEFYAELAAARLEYNILEVDQCGYDQGNQPSGITCDQHFGEDTSTP